MNSTEKKLWYQRIPHSYILIAWIIVAATVMTYIVPAGKFVREKITSGRTVVVPESFEYITQTPVSIWEAIKSIPIGFQFSANIIFMIMAAGSAFYVMQSSKAFDNGLSMLVRRFSSHKNGDVFMIWGITFAFGILGIIIGPEAHIPFIALTMFIALGMGFDAIVGLALVLAAGAIGFATAPINASTVGTSQGIAGLPLFSGLGFRFVFWFFATCVVADHIYRYAVKVKENPKLSLVSDLARETQEKVDFEEVSLSGRQKGVLVVMVLMIITLVIGSYKFGFYLIEMSCVFFIGGIVAGAVAGYDGSKIMNLMIEGASKMTYAALIVGVARGIQVVLESGNIADTIVYTLSQSIEGLSPYLAGIAMTLVQGVINFFIPSGSGQAAAVMPILLPVGELAGLTQQATIVAFQIGDSVTNIIYPTLGFVMAACGFANVPFDRWFRFALPLVGKIYILGAIVMCVAVAIKLGPF